MPQVPESYWRQELGESNSESNGIKWSFASRTLVSFLMMRRMKYSFAQFDVGDDHHQCLSLMMIDVFRYCTWVRVTPWTWGWLKEELFIFSPSPSTSPALTISQSNINNFKNLPLLVMSKNSAAQNMYLHNHYKPGGPKMINPNGKRKIVANYQGMILNVDL